MSSARSFSVARLISDGFRIAQLPDKKDVIELNILQMCLLRFLSQWISKGQHFFFIYLIIKFYDDCRYKLVVSQSRSLLVNFAILKPKYVL